MKNIYRLSTVVFVFCAAIVMLFTTVGANAQGRYAARYSKNDVSKIISRLEQSSDTFRRDFDHSMDRSNLNGTQAEDRFNNIVGDFENSIDQLRREFDRDDSWWQSRDNVESMVRDARPVNTMMTTISFRRNIERQWNQLRKDINTLADTYDLPGLNGGGWNGGGGGDGGWNGGGGGQTISPPSWAQGTFYGSTGGTQITLTISSNGSVNADIGGQMNYGTFTRGNNLQIAGATAQVTRQGNGILTTRTDTGERIAYTRTGWNGGNGGGGSGGDRAITPPSWAQGTFNGSASGTPITLTILSDGTVNADIGGQMNYGTFTRGNNIQIAGATAQVIRQGNGILTTRTDTGERIAYTRTGWDGRNDEGSGWNPGNRISPPSWARGTFYGRSDSGGQITLNISSNGDVTAIIDGQTLTGSFTKGNVLSIAGAYSRVTSISRGIRTVRTDNGETIDYRRQ